MIENMEEGQTIRPLQKILLHLALFLEIIKFSSIFIFGGYLIFGLIIGTYKQVMKTPKIELSNVGFVIDDCTLNTNDYLRCTGTATEWISENHLKYKLIGKDKTIKETGIIISPKLLNGDKGVFQLISNQIVRSDSVFIQKKLHSETTGK